MKRRKIAAEQNYYLKSKARLASNPPRRQRPLRSRPGSPAIADSLRHPAVAPLPADGLSGSLLEIGRQIWVQTRVPRRQICTRSELQVCIKLWRSRAGSPAIADSPRLPAEAPRPAKWSRVCGSEIGVKIQVRTGSQGGKAAPDQNRNAETS